MIISFWRYCHLALALTATVFILILAITGAILAFEPIDAKLEGHHSVDDFAKHSLAETIAMSKENFGEVISLETDANGFLSITAINKQGEMEEAYIHPLTGEKTGEIRQKSDLIQFATNLHRSLFLKGIGRFFVGLSSFLLFLIAISGLILLAKRQQGFRNLFGKVIKENFSQFGHVYLGRLTFLPILIIALTGVYLSLLRFSMIPEPSLTHEVNDEETKAEPIRSLMEMEVFAATSLSELRSLEFPFSEDPMDYFQLSIRDREVLVNQYTGEVLSEKPYPVVVFFTEWSSLLHTGNGTILWSVILGIASLSILFFVYSGFRMTLMRRSNKIKNEYGKNEAEYIILVGSETGTTMGFAKALHQNILTTGAKAYIGQMNALYAFPKMKQLIVLTATYGQGEAPANATNFAANLEKTNFNQPFGFAVIGFGSMAYPDFCQYAFDVDLLLEKKPLAQRVKAISTVNNRSWDAFKQWADEWSHRLDLNIHMPAEYAISSSALRKATFTVVKKTTWEDSFILELKSAHSQNIHSGDLLAVYPEDGTHERLYSIGKTKNNHLLIAVKRHFKGVCSNYLGYLAEEDEFNAKVVDNKSFYFPMKAKKVIMISSGTGLAPLLGMIDTCPKSKSIDLYWGGKTTASFGLYQPWVNALIENQKVHAFQMALSREEGQQKSYVQDLIATDAAKVTDALKQKAVIMICGSLAMQKGVTALLHEICLKQNGKPLSYYQKRKQILMDCY